MLERRGQNGSTSSRAVKRARLAKQREARERPGKILGTGRQSTAVNRDSLPGTVAQTKAILRRLEVDVDQFPDDIADIGHKIDYGIAGPLTCEVQVSAKADMQHRVLVKVLLRQLAVSWPWE